MTSFWTSKGKGNKGGQKGNMVGEEQGLRGGDGG